jgi:hypothetical protein
MRDYHISISFWNIEKYYYLEYTKYCEVWQPYSFSGIGENKLLIIFCVSYSSLFQSFESDSS